MSSRTERLIERFDTIQTVLKELHGDKLAFGAASAAWLSAIQYAVRQSLLQVARESNPRGYEETHIIRKVAEMELEMEALLQGFHREICKELGTSQPKSVDLAKAFEVVVQDICSEKG